jgi:hypothetical protein
MRPVPCVVSVAEHTGWAHLVCVAAHGNVPAVIARRRVVLIDQGLSSLPYEHETTAMGEDEANAVIAAVRQSIAARTSDALRRVVIELAPAHTAIALAIREPPFDDLPATVAAVRTSYRLLCAADGMLYQQATGRAATRRDTGRGGRVRQSYRPPGWPAVDTGAPASIRSRHRGAGGARAQPSQDSQPMTAQRSEAVLFLRTAS